MIIASLMSSFRRWVGRIGGESTVGFGDANCSRAKSELGIEYDLVGIGGRFQTDSLQARALQCLSALKAWTVLVPGAVRVKTKPGFGTEFAISSGSISIISVQLGMLLRLFWKIVTRLMSVV